MRTVTETAGARLAQMRGQSSMPEEIAPRFVHEGQGITLRRDSEPAGDTTFQDEGRTILLLEAQVSELLAEDAFSLVGAKLTPERPKEGE